MQPQTDFVNLRSVALHKDENDKDTKVIIANRTGWDVKKK